MQSNPFRQALLELDKRQEKQKLPPVLQRALDRKSGGSLFASERDKVRRQQGTVPWAMAQLDAKFGRRKDWQQIRPTVSEWMYSQQYGLRDGRIDILSRIGLEKPQEGESQSQFQLRVFNSHRVPSVGPNSSLARAEKAIASGDLSGLQAEHAQFRQGLELLRQGEVDRANEKERQRIATAIESLPFDWRDFEYSLGRSDVVRLKPGNVAWNKYPGGAMPIEDAQKLLQLRGIPVPTEVKDVPDAFGLRGLNAEQETDQGYKPLTEGGANMAGLEAVAQESLGDAIGIFTNPNATPEQTANGLVQILTSIPIFEPFKALAFAKGGLKKLLAESDDFAKSLEKLGLPKDVIAKPEFVDYWDSIAGKFDNTQGKGGLDEAAEFAAKQTQPPKITKDVPRATSLANQQQEREALSGVISKIDKASGKSAEHWMEEGKKAFTSIAKAKQLAAEIAQGKPLEPVDVGHLLEGKRQMLQEIEDLSKQLDAKPGDKDLLKKLQDAEDDLQGYLEDIQTGKGQASDVFRALQAGSTLDEGVFADVLAKMKRGGHATEGDIKTAKEASEKVKAADEDIKEAVKRSRESAEEGIKTARSKATDPEALAKEREKILAGLKKNGVTDDGLKQLAYNHARSAEGSLDEIVGKVRDDLKALDMDADPQKVIDAAAKPDPPKTITEAGQRAKELRGSARARSTEKFTKDVLKSAADELDEQIKAAPSLDEKTRLRNRLKPINDALAAMEKSGGSVKDRRRTLTEAWGKLKDHPNPEVKAMFKKWHDLQERILDLEEQATTGKLKPPKAKAPSEFEDLEAMRNMWAGRVRSMVEASKVPKWQRTLESIAGNVRGLSLGADIGVLFRQGLFTTARPGAFVKAIGEAGKTAFSEQNLARYQRNLDNAKLPNGRALAPIRKKAGLDLTDTFGRREELAVANVIKKIPLIGKAVGGSLERFQTAFINTARAEVFDAAVKRGYSDAELKLRAQFINNSTGRGNFSRSPGMLSQILMTSPRYEKSRWGMLFEPVKNTALLRAGSRSGLATGKMGFNRAAVANIQDMVVTASEVYGLFKLMDMAGYNVNYDPKSSDFLKMRKGDEVWDVTAGISPRMRDLMRVYVYARNQLDEENKRPADMMHNLVLVGGSALARTASPAVRTPLEKGSFLDQKRDLLANGWTFKDGVWYTPAGKKGQGPANPFSGWAFDNDDVEWPSLLPLVIQATIQTTKAEGGWAGAGAFLREFTGTSVNRYPSKSSAKKKEQKKSGTRLLSEEELRRMFGGS